MENLLLEPASFERERAVVMEERKYRYENSPRGQLYLAMMKAVFEGTPYGGSVIGEFEDLKSLSRDQVMEYFKKFYTPDNAIIVIAGNVDPSDTYSMVKEKFGKLASSTEEVRQYKKNADAPERYKLRSRWNREIRLRGEAQTPQFMMAFPGEAVGTRKAYVMDLLSSLLGSGVSSFFNQEFVKNRSPLLGEISVSSYNLMYNGVFFISGELLSKTNLTSFKSRLERDLKKTCKTAVVDRSVQKGKNQFLVSFFSGMQTNSGLAHSLGLSQLYFADHTHYKKELEIFQSITTQEVMDVCQDLFEKGPSLFLSVWKNHPGH
jgi:zinc protease